MLDASGLHSAIFWYLHHPGFQAQANSEPCWTLWIEERDCSLPEHWQLMALQLQLLRLLRKLLLSRHVDVACQPQPWQWQAWQTHAQARHPHGQRPNKLLLLLLLLLLRSWLAPTACLLGTVEPAWAVKVCCWDMGAMLSRSGGSPPREPELEGMSWGCICGNASGHSDSFMFRLCRAH